VEALDFLGPTGVDLEVVEQQLELAPHTFFGVRRMLRGIRMGHNP
jgi:hypothetical protein